jgi:hypothetical protein
MFAVPGARQWFEEEEEEQERRRAEEEEVEGADMDWRRMEVLSWGVVLGICVGVLDTFRGGFGGMKGGVCGIIPEVEEVCLQSLWRKLRVTSPFKE